MLLREGVPGRHVPSAGARHRSIIRQGDVRDPGEGVGSSPIREGSVLGGKGLRLAGDRQGSMRGGWGKSSNADLDGQRQARGEQHGVPGSARGALSDEWSMAL